MALALFDRVQETTTTTGTGSLTLAGAVAGFQSFAVVGDTNTCYYTIVDGGAWEVGIGTYSTTGPTLARTTVLSNSNADTSPITLAAGIKPVFLTYPAEKSVNLDASGNVSPLGTVSSGTWQGTTVGVAYGGTGVTASSGANSVVLRDSNGNITANNVFSGFTTTATTGGTTVLTVASTSYQRFTGTLAQTIQLPDATTLTRGFIFVIEDDSTQNLTVTDAASTTIDTIYAGGAANYILISNGTIAGTWTAYGLVPSAVDWGTNTLRLSGTVVTGGTWNGGTIAYNYGGTGLTTFAGANNALYSTGASTLTAGTLPVLAGGSGATTAAAARTNFGATTLGSNLFTITNPSAITFPRFNADNTVSSLDAATFRTAIGAGTSSTTGTVTSVGGTGSYGGLTLTGTVTTSGNLTLGGTPTGTWPISVSGNAATATTAANVSTGSSIKRTAAGAGYLDGMYAGVESTATSGAIYSIGGSYIPGTTTLGNMYGIGYGYSGNAGITATGAPGSLWGMYVASGGVSRIFFDADNGRGFFNGAIYSAGNIVLNAGNYTSYSPSLTGSGASGTWGINVTGNAATATTANALNTGNSYTGVSFTATSDERLKTNWRDLPMDFIERLAEVKHGTFDRVDIESTQDGVSAQSLQPLLKHSVIADENGQLSVNYGGAALVSAIQLAQRVVEQDARINRLEALVAELMGR